MAILDEIRICIVGLNERGKNRVEIATIVGVLVSSFRGC